jgi:DNA-binding response OmpR family regulator
MKVLIADDDAVCRNVLTMLLRKAGHEVTVFEDGATALAALKSPGAPQVAILDWMMPNLSGVEVCAELRASNLKQRTYVIMSSALTSKSDIVAGLDAGADDYLPKPVNAAELMARFRVAGRIIQYQHEMQGHIDELESMVGRYNLLGQMVAQQAGEQHPAASPPSVTEVKAGNDCGPSELTDREIELIVQNTLTELGLTEARLITAPGSAARNSAPYTAWAGLILPQKQLWIDVLLEATDDQVARICQKTLRRPGQPAELPRVLAETHTILSTALKAAIQAKGGEVHAPLLSRVRIAGDAPAPAPTALHSRSLVFTVAESPLKLTMVVTPCKTQQKRPDQIDPLDTLAKPVFMPDLPGMPLLMEGIAMHPRHIQRLANLVTAYHQDFSVPVFTPSPLAEFYCR